MRAIHVVRINGEPMDGCFQVWWQDAVAQCFRAFGRYPVKFRDVADRLATKIGWGEYSLDFLRKESRA